MDGGRMAQTRNESPHSYVQSVAAVQRLVRQNNRSGKWGCPTFSVSPVPPPCSWLSLCWAALLKVQRHRGHVLPPLDLAWTHTDSPTQSSSVRVQRVTSPGSWSRLSDGPGKKGGKSVCPQTTTDARLKRNWGEPQRMKPLSESNRLRGPSHCFDRIARPNRLTESEAKLSNWLSKVVVKCCLMSSDVSWHIRDK